MARVKPFPSNRLWIGFYSMPTFDLDIVPNVSSASVRLSIITDLVKNQLELLMHESIVLPNMDDFSFGPGFSDLDDLLDEWRNDGNDEVQDGGERALSRESGDGLPLFKAMSTKDIGTRNSTRRRLKTRVVRRNKVTNSLTAISPTSQEQLIASKPTGLAELTRMNKPKNQ
jgi:hypothetical protein